jgi:hypothetical protein
VRKRFEERDNVLRKRCQEKTDVKVKRCQETQLTWKRHVQGKRLEFREIERTCKRKNRTPFSMHRWYLIQPIDTGSYRIT